MLEHEGSRPHKKRCALVAFVSTSQISLLTLYVSLIRLKEEQHTYTQKIDSGVPQKSQSSDQAT